MAISTSIITPFLLLRHALPTPPSLLASRQPAAANLDLICFPDSKHAAIMCCQKQKRLSMRHWIPPARKKSRLHLNRSKPFEETSQRWSLLDSGFRVYPRFFSTRLRCQRQDAARFVTALTDKQPNMIWKDDRRQQQIEMALPRNPLKGRLPWASEGELSLW